MQLQRSQNVMFARMGTGGVVLSGTSRTPYVLNETASRFWELLGGTSDLEELISLMVRDYETSRQVVERDVRTLIEEFERSELLTIVDEARAAQ